MRTRDRAKIGATGGDNRVDVIALENISNRDRRNPHLVANAIGKWNLKHPAVHRPLVLAHLARGAVDHIGARAFEEPRDVAASSGVIPPGTQSCAEMRTLMGFSCGHTARIALKTSSG